MRAALLLLPLGLAACSAKTQQVFEAGVLSERPSADGLTEQQIDLNGDGLLDILLPQQTFGLSNGTQLLLRAPNGQYVAAFTQVFNEFGAAAAAAGKGSTGANGNVITMVNAPTRSPYSENDFEKEELMNMVMSSSAKRRTAAASCSRPSPKP
jgi:hypothetical protein